MPALVTPYTDIEKAPWEYLATQTAYKDLKQDDDLQEYRGYDGNYIPWDPEGGRVRDGALGSMFPAFGGILLGADGEKRGGRGDGNWIDELSVFLTLVYATEGFRESRARAENAANVIETILRSNDAKSTMLNSNGKVSAFTLSPSLLAPNYLDENNRAAITHWEVQWLLTLKGPIR